MQVYKLFNASVISLIFATSVSSSAYTQDITLLKQLEQSQDLRYTIKADSSAAGLTRWLKKNVEQSRVLPLATDFYSLKTSGPGTIQIEPALTKSGKGSILLETPASLGVKNPSNRSYAFAEMIRPLKGENLNAFNRFSVWVYVDAPGLDSVFVGCTLYNAGKHIMPVPDDLKGSILKQYIPINGIALSGNCQTCTVIL